jgi:tetratricopeptide (TPR) repeat protein
MKAFLSHSSQDKHYVGVVANRLGRARVEYDLMSFEPMVDFRDSIRAALARSECLVLFASRASLESLWVKYEIQSADELIRQGRLRSAVALIIDEQTTIADLPAWMRQARVERIRQPTRAARIISHHLHRLQGLDDQPPFIGRERLIAEMSRLLIGRPDVAPPRMLIVHGLPGTGRRTFLQHALKNVLSLELGPIFRVDAADDLETLHASLATELGELDTRAALSDAIARFRASSLPQRTEELGRLVAGLAEPHFAPAILDGGGLLQPNGHYVEGVLELLDELAASFPNVHLALIHARKPLVDRDRLTSFLGLQFRVPPIERQATGLLLSQCLRRAGITANPEEVAELAQYMDGYPPAVYLAVSLVKEYGLRTILADKSMLVDFKIRTFSQLLQKLDLVEPDWNCLRILASEPILPFEALAAVLGLESADMAAQLRRLIDLSLVTPHQDVFQIAPPIREAVFVARGNLADGEFGAIAAALEGTFWKDKDALPPIEIVAATVHAVSRSNAARLSQFGSLVLPSTLYRAAKEKYDEGGPEAWATARSLIDRVLEIDRSHRRARVLQFKLFVRLSEWDNAERVLREIVAAGDFQQHYLRGFMLWKRGQPEAAIEAFRNSLRVGYSQVGVFHGMAACQLKRRQVDEALESIREGLKHSSRPNKFLLDLGVQVAIEAEAYEEAKRYLDDLRRVGDEGGYHHRAAVLLSAQGKFAEALPHATTAVEMGRARFEVLANLINILIERDEFRQATSELNALDDRFKLYTHTHDVRKGLRCKLLVREQKWRLAEQVIDEIQDRRTPQYLALRFDILAQKVKDPTVTPGERATALAEREALVGRERRGTVLITDPEIAEPEDPVEGDQEGEQTRE